jgi:membrane-bound ClpP family serine protease
MNAFLSPTLAYIVLMLSIFFSLLAILSPGTGMLELLALTGLLFSGYAVYQLGITLWALPLLLLSVVPFIFSLRQTGWKRSLSLLGALSGMVIGSLFLFPMQSAPSGRRRWMSGLPFSSPLFSSWASGSQRAPFVRRWSNARFTAWRL